LSFVAVLEAAVNKARNRWPSRSKCTWTTRVGTDTERVDTWTQTKVSNISCSYCNYRCYYL